MNDAQPTRDTWWKNPSWIAAISAVLIGASALGVSLYQAYLMHEQQRMSVWPYLAFSHNNLSDHYTYSLSNEGVGPARIQYVEIRYKGEPIRQWNELLEKTYSGKESAGVYSYLSKRVVPMNTKIDAFQLQLGEPSKAFRLATNDARIEVCYCSIYDDCYLYVNDADVSTQTVASCPDNKTQIFRN